MIDSVSRSLVPDLSTPASGSTASAPANDNAFRGTLWEAFTGHAGPVTTTTAAPPVPAPVPQQDDGKVAAAMNQAPIPQSSSGTGPAASPSLVRDSAVRNSPATPVASPAASGSSSASGARRDGATTDPVKAVSDAMRRVGLDPTKYNLRTGSMPITIPGGNSYEYPVLWADVGTETLGFWLPSALSSPGMIAANIGNMIGTPIYEIV